MSRDTYDVVVGNNVEDELAQIIMDNDYRLGNTHYMAHRRIHGGRSGIRACAEIVPIRQSIGNLLRFQYDLPQNLGDELVCWVAISDVSKRHVHNSRMLSGEVNLMSCFEEHIMALKKGRGEQIGLCFVFSG